MNDPARPRWPHRILAVTALSLVAAARLFYLDADPPASMPDPSLMDEGLWSDSARGLVRFADPFADDLGNAWLIAPLYTLLQAGIYQLLGIGLWQTRVLSALASITTAALAGHAAARRAGPVPGCLVLLLCLLCPLLDQHGRFALLEGPLGTALLASFLLLFPQQRTLAKSGLGGALLGAAFLLKPNAVTFGAVPFAIAYAVAWRHAVRMHEPAPYRTFLGHGAIAALAAVAILAAIGGPIWHAHQAAFLATVASESGSANWRLADHVLRFGLLFAREGADGREFMWGLLRHAPCITCGLWLALAHRALGHRRTSDSFRPSLAIWVAIGFWFAETSYDHVSRRAVLFVPPLALWLVLTWRAPRAADAPPWRAFSSFVLLLAPLGIAAKPALAQCAAAAFALGGLSELSPETRGHLGGFAGLAAWLSAAALLTWLRCDPVPWLRRSCALGPVLCAILLASEALRLGALPPHEFTMRTAQQQIRGLVSDGEVAIGDFASVLLQSTNVITVRRVLPGARYSSPRPNPDVVLRLRPRYVIDYVAPELREFADVTDDGFRPIQQFYLLREPGGGHRYVVQLWERQ